MNRTLVPCMAVVAIILMSATAHFRKVQAQSAKTLQEARTDTIAPIGVLQSGPSLTPAQIDGILSTYGSPATGSGQDFYDLGVAYGIDPAYAVAFFVEESSAGTDPRWDGHKPDGTTTHDIGNISCAGYPTCYGRWRDYPDWRTGIEDWYRLIRDEYIIGRGHQTVDDVIPIYAPAFENDVGGYTNTVNALVAQWRGEQQQQPINGVVSNPIAIGNDDCGWNVIVALNASSGALQDVRLMPGETFSFNATMGDPAYIPYQECAGVKGGNWCNLAARYAQVARGLGLTPRFQDHGLGDIGAGPENSVAIWNEAGIAGAGQDLLVENTTGNVVWFRAQQQGDSVVIVGGME